MIRVQPSQKVAFGAVGSVIPWAYICPSEASDGPTDRTTTLPTAPALHVITSDEIAKESPTIRRVSPQGSVGAIGGGRGPMAAAYAVGAMAELSSMYGTRLFDQPRHAPVRARLDAFVSRPAPLGLEIGFDHGMCILDRARRFPELNHLGVELREARVEAAAANAPENCLLLRIDARTLCVALLPDASVDWLYLLFPTPPSSPKRALLSEAFAAGVARVLKPGGGLWFATDVPALYAEARRLFPWPDGPPPPLGAELSRRERVCRRDGIEVFRLCLKR